MSLYRKYRPQKFSSLVGEDHIRDTLLTAIKEDRVSHAYLFSGPRGTGKTTVARLLAKAVNCKKRSELNGSGSGEPCDECEFCKEIAGLSNMDIVEIDAASNRGIDEIRELRDKIRFAPTTVKYKVYIIDEVHMLTLPAFNALLKTLEEPPKHAIFILATTDPQKVPATILSRVQRFDFRRISKNDIVKNLKTIVKSEGFEASDQALEAIAVVAEGSHRDSISLLEQVSSLNGKIEIENVRNILGLSREEELLRIIQLIADGKKKEAIAIISEFVSAGVESTQINKGLVELLRQLLLVKISGGDISFEITDERMSELNNLAGKFTASQINQILEIFIKSSQLMKETSIRTLPIEMAIIESCGLNEVASDKLQVASNKPQATSGVDEKIQQPKAKVEEKKPVEENPEIKKTDIEQVEVAAKKDSVPIKLDEESWKLILDKIKVQNHTLNALLRDARSEGIEGDKLVLSVRFKFHHEKISETKNSQIIEQVIEEVLGKKYRVACQIGDFKKKKGPEDKSGGEVDLEEKAKEMFDVE